MATQGFGKPKYGNQGNFAKNIRLKEGTATVVRIIPPMKSLAETGEWAVYIGTHFGYKGVNQKDRSKPVYRTFKCIEVKDFKTKMILEDCPECDWITSRVAELKDLEADLKQKKTSEEDIKELTKPLKDWLSDHNCDRKWHMNVMLQDGTFAILQISHKTKKLLEAEIARVLTEDGIEALEPDQGVWFRFSRTGKGIDTQDTVTVEYESVKDSATGRVVRTVKLAPLTDAQAEKALKDCPDLTTTVTIISKEQIKLLTECSGEDEEVDAIFALGKKKEASPKPSTATRTPAPQQPKTETKAEAKVETPAPEAPVEDEETAILKALEEARARKAAAAAAKVSQAQKNTEAPAATPANAPQTQESVPATAATSPASGLPVDRQTFLNRFKQAQTQAQKP
jgi:hypothetical protein